MANLFRGSSHALAYSKFRISPPTTLVDSVINYCKLKIFPPLRNAVDIGCGTGHSTLAFAPYFQNIVGIDISEAQVNNAKEHRSAKNISYRVSPAEETGIKDSSVQVVTVGQALHWFDMDNFFKEVKRILIPNGVVAIYGYWLPVPEFESKGKNLEAANFIENYLHDEILGNYWDTRRIEILRPQYANVHFPFDSIVRENMISRMESTVTDYIGYFTSWSAYQKLEKEDPLKASMLIEEILDRLMKLSGSESLPEKTKIVVATDFFTLLGTNPKSNP